MNEYAGMIAMLPLLIFQGRVGRDSRNLRTPKPGSMNSAIALKAWLLGWLLAIPTIRESH
jgi:hypothetical protein